MANQYSICIDIVISAMHRGDYRAERFVDHWVRTLGAMYSTAQTDERWLTLTRYVAVTGGRSRSYSFFTTA
jgi:hypothetical protein